MKKLYSKPEIMFENFTLSVNIAAGCEATANTYANYDACGYYFSGKVIFGTDLTGCKVDGAIQIAPYDGTSAANKNDRICYHVPSMSNNIFNS